jgi:hypothetical protein
VLWLIWKARVTVALKPDHPLRTRFWTKHGSTRYLWTRISLDAAIDYVINQQGAPMECWIDTNRCAHGSE